MWSTPLYKVFSLKKFNYTVSKHHDVKHEGILTLRELIVERRAIREKK